jgi:hypothetical protein
MTAASQSALPNVHAISRSMRRPERPDQNRNRKPDEGHHENPWLAAVQLVGHMAATTFIFTSFVTLVWLASWGFSFLNSVHSFSDDDHRLFETLESVLIRIDAALSSVVLTRGLILYVLSIVRSKS